MRLINADAFERNIYNERKVFFIDDHKELLSKDTIYELIADEPTIDAEPVRHGSWAIRIDDYDCEYMECSECGSIFYDGDNDTVDTLHNYCPNCGAQMDGEVNG